MKNKSLLELLCISGVMSFIFYVLHDIIGGLNYPGYDRMSQALSDLTAISAPSYVIATSLSSVYALFGCLNVVIFTVLIKDHAHKTLRLGIYLFAIMTWISGVGYALFPLSESGFNTSFTDIMHVYVITITVVLLSITSLVMISVGGMKKDKDFKLLGRIACIALILMFTGAIGSGVLPKMYFGMIERFSTYSAVLFNAFLGIYGLFYLNKIKLKKQSNPS